MNSWWISVRLLFLVSGRKLDKKMEVKVIQELLILMENI